MREWINGFQFGIFRQEILVYSTEQSEQRASEVQLQYKNFLKTVGVNQYIEVARTTTNWKTSKSEPAEIWLPMTSMVLNPIQI